jgi:hypothetical protein
LDCDLSVFAKQQTPGRNLAKSIHNCLISSPGKIDKSAHGFLEPRAVEAHGALIKTSPPKRYWWLK